MPVELAGNMPSRMPGKAFYGRCHNKGTLQGNYLSWVWGSGYQLGAAGPRVLQDSGAKEPERCRNLMLQKPRVQQLLEAGEASKAAGGRGTFLTLLPKEGSARRSS